MLPVSFDFLEYLHLPWVRMTKLASYATGRWASTKISIAFLPQFISPVVTFAIFAAVAHRSGTKMDPSRLFPSLSLLLLLAEPLFSFYDGLYAFMSAVGCARRIETYLQTTPRRERRDVLSRPGENTDSTEEKSKPNTTAKVPEQDKDIACISIQNGSFGWNGEVKLRNINISIPTGEVVFVVGPVACGKSTLLKALLGETPLFDGMVSLATSEIAYCAQSPWLMVSPIYRTRGTGAIANSKLHRMLPSAQTSLGFLFLTRLYIGTWFTHAILAQISNRSPWEMQPRLEAKGTH